MTREVCCVLIAAYFAKKKFQSQSPRAFRSPPSNFLNLEILGRIDQRFHKPILVNFLNFTNEMRLTFLAF